MAASIDHGVLLNILKDHQKYDVTFEDNIVRSVGCDMIPDWRAVSWTSGAHTVYLNSELGNDRAAYPYSSPLGTVNTALGKSTFYTDTDENGSVGLFTENLNEITGAKTSRTLVNYMANVESFEVCVAVSGQINRNNMYYSYFPEDFFMSGQSAVYVRITIIDPETGARNISYVSVSSPFDGSVRIRGGEHLYGTELGDVEEILTEIKGSVIE